jgi:ABC-type transporter Mla subunit MlaD
MSNSTPQVDIQKMVSDVLALLRGIDPVTEGVKLAEQGRRTIEALIVALENVGETMDNLNNAASRVNRLLDDVEEPIRRIAGMADQAGSLVSFLPSLASRAVSNLAPKPPSTTASATGPSGATPPGSGTASSSTANP